MTDKHFYGKYEITEDYAEQTYLATVKLHNSISQITLTAPAIAVLKQHAIQPQIIVHNIIKDPTQLKTKLTITEKELSQYLD